MCGIVGYTGKDNAAAVMLDGLEKLEYRGYDSAGIAVINKNKIKCEKTVGRIKTLREVTHGGDFLRGNCGIGHTRWATHGAPNEQNAHPHLSGKVKFAVVHNGIIENYAKLKKQLKADGVMFLSDTDTEVIPHLLEKHYSGNLLEAVTKAVSFLEGSFALGIICDDYPETLIAVRHFSPLIIGVGDNANYIASDVTALVNHTKSVVYIEDGEVAVLTPESVQVYDRLENKVDYKISEVTWDISAAQKGGFDHFMMKEIYEQPGAVRQTIESRIKRNEVFFESIKLDSNKLKEIKNIHIVACGSAYHAAVVGKYVFDELLRIPVFVDIASEYRYRNPIVDSSTLVIIISQSGETADTLAALNKAKEKGAYVVAVVNVVGSSIAKAADDVIYTHAGPEISVATTKGYSTQLAVLYLLAVWAAAELKTAEKKELHFILSELRTLPEKIERILEQQSLLKEMAQNLGRPESLFFIGRNIDYAVALEASLKLKEISYIHSEAYAAGELKHGTISLIEQGRVVIALNCYSQLSDKLLSNIKEVKARGAYVITATDSPQSAVAKESDKVILVPKTHPLLAASLEVIPFQLYAYYVALFNGCDIDKPRNLAKSVTVE